MGLPYAINVSGYPRSNNRVMFSRLILIALVCLLQLVSSTQLTFDPCCQDSDCVDGLVCISTVLKPVFSVGPCAPGLKCACQVLSTGFRQCIADAECPENEACDITTKSCASKCFLAADGRRELDEDEKPICDNQTSFPSVCPPEDPTGSESPETPDGNAPPTSTPLSQPPSDPDGAPTQQPEETPQTVVATPTPVSGAEVSPTTGAPQTTPTPVVEETPEPTTAVCVAVEELEGVQKVFEQDYHAWVLCDSTGSCATPGHMVMWNGDGMMMKSYCDIVGCERKVMAVNSPRWSAGAIRAKTEGLAYTSFAARWESKAEERVLAAVVRVAV